MEHLRLLAVEVELQVGRLRVVAGERHQHVRVRVDLREELVLHLVHLHRIGFRLILDVHGDSVRHAESGNGGRHEHLPLRFRNRREQTLYLANEHCGVLFRQRTLVPALEVDDKRGLVLAASADHAPACDGEDALHLWQRAQQVDGAQGGIAAAVARGALGHLHRGEDDALVLVRKERGLRLGEERDCHEDGQQKEDAREEDAACEPLRGRDEQSLEFLYGPVEPGERAVLVRTRLAQDERAESRRERERAQRGEAHRRGKRHGELLVDAAGDAAHEADGHEDAQEHERRGDDGARHVAHRLDRRLLRVELACLDEELHARDHDDAVVHHHADCEHQPEQREDVDRVAENGHEDER